MAGEMTAEEVRHHVKQYILVFAALLFLTVVTVGVSYLEFETPMAIFVAMVIAVIKASLVASVFMHLMGEKKVIYWTLLLTILFFIPLITIPIFSDVEQVNYLKDLLANVP